MLYPVAPHITHALWQELGYAADARRPARRALAAGRRGGAGQDEIELVLQVNGKLRGAIRVPPSADKAAIEAAALASADFVQFAEGRPPKKVVVVPGRLVNVVV